MAQRNGFNEKKETPWYGHLHLRRMGRSLLSSIGLAPVEATANTLSSVSVLQVLAIPSLKGPSLDDMPDEILLMINDHVSSAKDKAHAAMANNHLYRVFQPEIGKSEAKEAAEYAINPTKENVEKLKALLIACPALLQHPMTIRNRHGEEIKGTVYQIALHECDDELINDVIKPGFEKLENGLETMEAQRTAWLTKGWLEAEEKVCAEALAAIDNLFTAFKNASRPNDVTELQQKPYTITINNQDANTALEAFRKAIDALYQPTNEVITSGRDPSIRLLERVIDRYIENYDVLGGYNTAHNNALLRKCFGYIQRFAPINLMQAFAQDPYYIIEDKEKLTRSLENRFWKGHFILPLDFDPSFRLGYDFFVCVCGRAGWAGGGASVGPRQVWFLQNFLSIKNSSSSTVVRYANS